MTVSAAPSWPVPTLSAASPVPTATPAPEGVTIQRADLASPLPTPPSTAPPPCAYDAAFVADVTIPDDTVLPPGTPFTKTWRLRNNGTCNWVEGAVQLAFGGGERLGGPFTVPVPPTRVGETVDLSLALTAPDSPGTYRGDWRLQTTAGDSLGDSVYVRVVVPAPATPTPTLAPQPVTDSPAVPRLVLLNYFAWYDSGGWDGCNISAGDRPLEPYSSDDPAAIARHVRMALEAGADGFTLQWFAPGERTDRNLEQLLAQSQGTPLRSTVVFLRHIWPGSPAPTQANVTEALRYLLDRYSAHPNFLTLEGRPVIFVTDVYRVPLAPGQTPQQAWAAIRAQADPDGHAWWIAEGLDPSYLAVFDGLWVYKITHASAPDAYLKAGQWAAAVRQWEAQTGRRKLWVATITPGWDDLRAGCKADIRVPSQPHQVPRADGAFYRATFEAALSSNPDWLWVNSFNEWVEGTYIEPGQFYGDLYLQLTREFAEQFR